MASATTKEEKKERGDKKSKVTEASLNMAELRELADLVNENGFTDFEFENEKIRVRLSKNIVAAPSTAMPVANPVASVQETVSVESVNEKNEDEGLFMITSPIVGTFYSAPSPDKPAFVKEGDKVEEETVVCIVEAMKLMNEIQAETSGEIVKIYVENAQPVEYGQPLFGIKQ
jgi:acetyl-CoA carboxylase biotin carboxyl carrier protein